MITTQSMHILCYIIRIVMVVQHGQQTNQLLFKYCFRFVCISQNLGDINIFYQHLNKDIYRSKQDWYGKLEITDKLYTYATFKSLL